MDSLKSFWSMIALDLSRLTVYSNRKNHTYNLASTFFCLVCRDDGFLSKFIAKFGEIFTVVPSFTGKLTNPKETKYMFMYFVVCMIFLYYSIIYSILVL